MAQSNCGCEECSMANRIMELIGRKVLSNDEHKELVSLCTSLSMKILNKHEAMVESENPFLLSGAELDRAVLERKKGGR